jgi:hypothetical protein
MDAKILDSIFLARACAKIGLRMDGMDFWADDSIDAMDAPAHSPAGSTKAFKEPQGDTIGHSEFTKAR